ncbi:MAG: hypothetical protein BJ554DRAFT_7625 [Olpidium bornovanus]|uniref:Uncharacterized protein n=1 Tax=Olpidium bornovanus TaxID=278681 RepID=A0A8H7ZW66_9FUNG|nr:MAG: hypothetical protein BJ554DRAFT_7625 [Olpidium bornovanus]
MVISANRHNDFHGREDVRALRGHCDGHAGAVDDIFRRLVERQVEQIVFVTGNYHIENGGHCFEDERRTDRTKGAGSPFRSRADENGAALQKLVDAPPEDYE